MKKSTQSHRASAGHIDVGTAEEGGIEKLISFNNRLIIVKTNAVYEVVTADSVDPERKTATIPRMIQKKITSMGTESDFVAKSLLTASLLFRKGSFSEPVIDNVLSLVFEMLPEFDQLNQNINEYSALEQELIESHSDSGQSEAAFSIPSIADIETRARTIFQKVDQICQILIKLIRLFYPKDKRLKLTPYEQLHHFLISKYGEDDGRTKFLAQNLEFFCHVRTIRNGLDHRLPSVVVEDFLMVEDGEVSLPSIRSKVGDCKLEKKVFGRYIKDVEDALIHIVESMLCVLAGDNLTPNGLGLITKAVPEEKRIFKNVRYSLWSPVGDGGFYLLK